MEVILWQKHIKEKNIICDKCKCEEMEIMERLKEYNVVYVKLKVYQYFS